MRVHYVVRRPVEFAIQSAEETILLSGPRVFLLDMIVKFLLDGVMALDRAVEPEAQHG